MKKLIIGFFILLVAGTAIAWSYRDVERYLPRDYKVCRNCEEPAVVIHTVKYYDDDDDSALRVFLRCRNCGWHKEVVVPNPDYDN